MIIFWMLLVSVLVSDMRHRSLQNLLFFASLASFFNRVKNGKNNCKGSLIDQKELEEGLF